MKKYLSALFLIVVAVIVAVSLTAKSDSKPKAQEKHGNKAVWRYSNSWESNRVEQSDQNSVALTCEKGKNLLTGWKKIFLSGHYTCGIMENTLHCWSYRRPITEVEKKDSLSGSYDIKGYDSISAGFWYLCGIKKGELYCWGNNYRKLFGKGAKGYEEKPFKVSEIKNWQKVSIERSRICGIADGELYCWGNNSSDSNIPAKIGGCKKWEDVFTGYQETCGIMDGELYCWSSYKNSWSDNKFKDNIRNWKKVVLSSGFDCGITKDNKLYCWGWRSDYLPHEIKGNLNSSVPERVVIKDENEKWEDISLSQRGLCGIADGILYCWGDKIIERNREVENSEKIVKAYKSSEPWESVIREGNNICAFKKGEVYCWGRDSGRLYSCDRAGGMKEPEFEKIIK